MMVKQLFQPVPHRHREYEGWQHAEYEGCYSPTMNLPLTSTIRGNVRTNSADGEETWQQIFSGYHPHLNGDNERLARQTTTFGVICKHKNDQKLCIAPSYTTKHYNKPNSQWEHLLFAIEGELNTLEENQEGWSSTVLPDPSVSSHYFPQYGQGSSDVRHNPSNKPSPHVSADAMGINPPILSSSFSSPSFGQGCEVRPRKKRACDNVYDPSTSLKFYSATPKYDAFMRNHHLKNSKSGRRGPRGLSRFKGVCITKTGKWRAIIYSSRKQKYLGVFENEEDAAKAYDRGAIELFGESANLNFSYIKPQVL